MSSDAFRIKNRLKLEESSVASNTVGEVRLSTDGELYHYDGSEEQQLINESQLADMAYDNGSSGLAATNPQAAIDENASDISAIDTRLTTAEGEINTLQADVISAQDDATAAQADIDDHIADTVAAHAGTAIANTPSGNLAATTVQAALNELQTDVDTRATATALTDHISDAADAHAASAITNTPSGNLAATTVQAALNELQTELDPKITASSTDTLTNKTATNIVLNGTLTGTAILDQDDMSSNSATAVPTQQSVKAYVDANAGGFGSISSKTANYTTTDADGLVNCSTNAFTITLHTPGFTGKTLRVKKTDTSLANIISISGTGLSTALHTVNETVNLLWDGSAWGVLERIIPSNWTTYTPTFAGVGTVSAVNIFYRRVGDSIQIAGYATTGTVVASTFSMTLPSGLSGDFTKMGTSNVNIRGRSYWAAASANNDYTMITDQSQPTLIYVGMTDSASRSPNTTVNGGTLFGTTNVMYFDSTAIPISGWNG
jgi:hypothetical protein